MKKSLIRKIQIKFWNIINPACNYMYEELRVRRLWPIRNVHVRVRCSIQHVGT